jgi:hypothetical protein
MDQIKLLLPIALIGLTCVSCNSSSPALSSRDRAVLALDLAHTRPAGQGSSFRPGAVSAAVAAGAPVGPWRCLSHRGSSYGAHLELFAEEHEIVVPAGIGVREPRRDGAYVVGGRCLYPVTTADPTGVIEVDGSRAAPDLGVLFRLWGQPLTAHRLGAFTGKVSAFVNGRGWAGDPRAIRLPRHAQIVLEVCGFVAPHSSYGFPPGF